MFIINMFGKIVLTGKCLITVWALMSLTILIMHVLDMSLEYVLVLEYLMAMGAFSRF